MTMTCISKYHIIMGIIFPCMVQLSIQTLVQMQNANHENPVKRQAMRKTEITGRQEV
jgi:hypothetical protein